jgi:hypothetical protein
MKIAFVAGFYDPVKEALDISHSAHEADGSLIWIRQRELHREADLTALSARLLDIAKDADFIRIILHVPRGREWVTTSIQGIVASGMELNAKLQCEIVPFGNDGDCEGVLKCVAGFDLPAPDPLNSAEIRKRIPAGKVLCMSLEGKTSVIDALERAGFSPQTIAECFEEERREGGQNSNLLQHLSSRSLQYRYLVYAFEGLRTLSPAIKHKFAKCWEASNAAKAVALLKKWITEGD